MSDTWDGRPERPERDGDHVFLQGSGKVIRTWNAANKTWWYPGAPFHIPATDAAAYGWRYLGPCLTPAEVQAREAAAAEQAWKEGYVNACGTFIGSTEGDAREAAEKGWAINSHNHINFDALARALAQARAEEREACGDVAGQVADEFRQAAYLQAAHGASHAAAAIRARGKEVGGE